MRIASLAGIRCPNSRATTYIAFAHELTREDTTLFDVPHEALHPKEPYHYYLFAIGVDPSLQGGGRGSRLIRANLDRCDAEGVPAYLENSKEQNLPFYERHGFRVIERHDMPNDGPSVWRMWREPGASS